MEGAVLNFTLKQLRYVEAAGRLGSIASAATDLNISQSSITAAIDALEQSLGYDIFVRTPAKGIQATPSGKETLQLIRNFIDQSRHFEADIKSVGGDATGLVRIACYATAAPSFLPPILKTITEEFPGISVRVLEGNMSLIMDFLNSGEADLAFIYTVPTDDRHDFEPLFSAPPYALVAPDDPAVKNGEISYAELAERPMVLLDLPLTSDYFIGMFEQRGLQPNIAHSTRSTEIARALVASGFGYSILNIRPPDIDEEGRRYRALRIRDATEIPVFGIATMAGIRQPRTVRSFIESCIRLRDKGIFEQIVVKSPTTSSDKK